MRTLSVASSLPTLSLPVLQALAGSPHTPPPREVVTGQLPSDTDPCQLPGGGGVGRTTGTHRSDEGLGWTRVWVWVRASVNISANEENIKKTRHTLKKHDGARPSTRGAYAPQLNKMDLDIAQKRGKKHPRIVARTTWKVGQPPGRVAGRQGGTYGYSWVRKAGSKNQRSAVRCGVLVYQGGGYFPS